MRFKPNFLHGFEGQSFAAISMHYTDKDEIKALGGDMSAIVSPDAMEALTQIVDQSKIDIIAEDYARDISKMATLDKRGKISSRL
ncbi:hypothetical protein N9W34_03060 [Rickettsiales bacterium]|nr:hypothetical protein [Rickettsiales bacterium]